MTLFTLPYDEEERQPTKLSLPSLNISKTVFFNEWLESSSHLGSN